MTVNDLISELTKLKKKLRKKEVFVISPKGNFLSPEVGVCLEHKHAVLNYKSKNVKSVVISWEWTADKSNSK